MLPMIGRSAVVALWSIASLTGVAGAQTATSLPDFSGVWGPYRAGRGADPQFAPPPASPIVLKAEFAKPYEARRAAEADAAKRGTPAVTSGTLCAPYGVPTMMSVAAYPVEIIQTRKQVTIITEAFSEVRRVYLDKPQERIDDVPPGYYGRSVGRWDGDTWSSTPSASSPRCSISACRTATRCASPNESASWRRLPARSDHDRGSRRAREAHHVHAGLSAAAELRNGRIRV